LRGFPFLMPTLFSLFVFGRRRSRQGVALGIGLWLLGVAAVAAEVRSYDIPSSDGVTALRTFLEQSGADVVYANADLRQVRSNRLAGPYSTAAALERLFAGTALVIVRDERTGSFLIRRADEPRGETPAGSPPPSSAMNKKTPVSLLARSPSV